jgi:hypothetical protein
VTLSWKLFTTLCFASVSLLAWAGEPRRVDDLKPRTVTIPSDEMMLDRALVELHKQTGNVVEDRRGNTSNLKLKLPAKSGTFWEMLDSIGKETKIGVDAYQADGGVALVDRAYRELRTDYSGIFRFAVKRVDVFKDEETQVHQCQVTLDAAWEPRFKALYVNLDHASAVFGKQRETMERESQGDVAGKCATYVVLRMKAPERSAAKIDSLKGAIRVIGVPTMLDFALPKLPTDKIVVQEGVKVSLTYVNQKSAKRWTVDLLTEYPPGAIVALESFQQTWRDGNRVWLSWGIDPKTKKPYELEPSSRGEPQELQMGTKIQYYFTPRGETPLPPAGTEVTLRYRTPNRVVALTVPFAFQDLPLP